MAEVDDAAAVGQSAHPKSVAIISGVSMIRGCTFEKLEMLIYANNKLTNTLKLN